MHSTVDFALPITIKTFQLLSQDYMPLRISPWNKTTVMATACNPNSRDTRCYGQMKAGCFHANKKVTGRDRFIKLPEGCLANEIDYLDVRAAFLQEKFDIGAICLFFYSTEYCI